MLNDTVGGISKDLTLSPSGDYCNYYGEGDNLTLQISANQGGATGYTTPEPFSSYQEGDANGTVCQANGSHWGQEIRSGVSGYSCPQGSKTPCGMHHYVSFTSQGSNHRPWSGVFGEPSLVVSAEADTATFTHSGLYYGGWSYVCPEVEDTSSHGVIEYCLEEWRSANDESSYKGEAFGECNNPFSQIRSLFYSGTQYATEMAGSANSTESAGNAHYEARITKTNLINAAKLVNSNCAGWHLSENPENYALIGVEQGVEGWDGLTEMAGSTGNLRLHTEYTPKPPTATTSAASGVSQAQATLNGTVNPNGAETKYYFEYGTSTSYGSSTSEVSAGSGTTSTPVNAVATSLVPGTLYHYRLVAKNVGGSSYGSDQTFYTQSAEYVFYRGPNGGLENGYWTGSYWEFGAIGSASAVTGNPSPVLLPTGKTLARGIIDVFYRGTNGGLQNWYWSGSAWSFASIGTEKAIEGSPSAIALPENHIDVFYRGTTGGLQNWYWNGSTWSYSAIGAEKVMAGEPDAIALPEGHIDVFYRGTTGGLQNDYWNGSTWSYGAIGSEKVMEGNPSAIALPENHIDVFYRGTTGGLQNWYWNGSTWSYGAIGSEKVMAGNPSAVALSEGHINVFYRATNNGLQNWYWSSPTWSYGAIGSEKTMSGDPNAVTWPNGNIDVFYRGPGEILENWFWSTPTWSQGALSGEKAIAGEPSAVAW